MRLIICGAFELSEHLYLLSRCCSDTQRVKLAHPNSSAAWLNLLSWYGLRSECADLLSSYEHFSYSGKRAWYIRATKFFGWSKQELAKSIEEKAHLNRDDYFNATTQNDCAELTVSEVESGQRTSDASEQTVPCPTCNLLFWSIGFPRPVSYLASDYPQNAFICLTPLTSILPFPFALPTLPQDHVGSSCASYHDDSETIWPFLPNRTRKHRFPRSGISLYP